MKANRTFLKTPDGGPDAVTAILGAILVVALLVGLLVTVRVAWVPVWEADAEASHMFEVSQQLAAFKAQLDRQAGNATQVGEVSSEILLGQTRTSLFAQNRLPGTLRFTDTAGATSGINITSDEMTVIITNGTLVPIADNLWTEIPITTEVNNVSQIAALRIRTDTLANATDGDTVTITLRDEASGSFQGSFTVLIERDPPDVIIWLETRNKHNDLLQRYPLAFKESALPTGHYFVNAMDFNYVFDQVLAAAAKPMHMTLSYSDSVATQNDPAWPADYSVAYFKSDGGGSGVLAGSGGALEAPFARSFSGGTLSYIARNSYFVPQTYVVENGAIVLDQGTGAAFHVPPNLNVIEVAGVTRVSLTIPNLAGDEATVAGPRSATLFSAPRASTSLSGLSTDVNLTIGTAYPDLWLDVLRKELESAGLSSAGAQPQFRLSATGDTVTVTVYGTDSDPASTVNDINLELTQANLQLRIEA